MRPSPSAIAGLVSCVAALLLFSCVGATVAKAQTVTVRGFISDRASGIALEGANVSILDGEQVVLGAASNAVGFYQVAGLQPGRYVLRISYVGYETVRDTLDLGDEPIVNRSVSLKPGALLDEIVIREEGGAARLEAGQQTVRPIDLERIPTPDPAGDLATYLQTLPGVVSLGDRGGQLYIRGGTPSQNLVLLDGTLIFQPFHIVGFFSAFPQDLISSVDVYAGGYGPRYNGRLSSVIDVTTRGGNANRVEGAASIGPFLTSLRIEGPVQKGRLSWLGSVRSSVIEQTGPAILGEDLALKFSDVLIKLEQSNVRNRRCSVTAVHTYDRGRIDPDSDRDDVFRWRNAVLAGRCVGFSPNSLIYVEANSGFSYVKNSVGSAVNPEREANAILFNTDVNWTYPMGTSEIRGGVFLQVEGGAYRLEEQYTGLRLSKEFHVGTGLHIGARLNTDGRLRVEPGLAFTYPLAYAPSLEPRLRLSWRPWGTNAQILTAALGIYRQTVEGINDERDVGALFTAWVPAPVDDKRSRAVHALLGWQQRIGPFNFAAEGYYKRLNDLPVPIWSVVAQFTTELALADGDVYGADTRVEFQQGPIYAYVGYGFSRTRYTTAQENFGVWFGDSIQSYHPPHDRRHQVNALLAYTTGRFEASLRWQFGSGVPYTQSLGTDAYVRLLSLPDVRRVFGTPRFLFDKPYRGRLPSYHRLDVSAQYRFSLSRADLTVQGGAINAYNQENLFYLDLYEFRRVNQFPLLPFVSLLVEVNR